MKILEILKEANGQYSSARLFALLVVLGTMIDWMYSVFNTPTHIWNPEWQTIAMVLGVLGFKVIQKFSEINEINKL